MSNQRRALVSEKACIRCSTQKRRCDRAIPHCGLCSRLGHICTYERFRMSSSGPTPSPSPRPESFLSPWAITPSHLKNVIAQTVGAFSPEESISAYCREIEPWFPILSISRLQLPLTWDEAPLDFALLCLSIVLLTNAPTPLLEDENNPSEFKSLYLCAKSCIASTEGIGINSLLIVQARILVTLFEVAHGLYPAAYISIGAIIRATDALGIHLGINASLPIYDDDVKGEETILTWCGILMLDRYIAIESGPQPSLTRSRSQFLHDILKPIMCPTHQHGKNPTSPICRLSRLLEASLLLDKIHTTLNSPMSDHQFNIDELFLTVETLLTLQTILNEEIGNGIPLYTGGLSLCRSALLLAFENGIKENTTGITEHCNSIATTELNKLLPIITNIVEPFSSGRQPIDFSLLPPFATLLVYKAAMITTERLLVKSNLEELKRLRILRNFLRIVGKRWLSCERYLKLLDEDTTPRILKAVE